jgi:hypothetical protein
VIEDDSIGGLVDMLITGSTAGDRDGCYQCDADVAVVHHFDGVGVLEIRHEPDCPELARLRQGNRADRQ